MTYKVQISSSGGTVIFEASTPITESRSANYEGYNIVHLPTDIWAYRNTTGRKFNIPGKLVSRTPKEADANAKYVDLIRSWVLPDFGGSGATPPLVRLSAFNNSNLKDLQCIVRSYSISYPDDVDWIFSGSVPMPVICIISIDLDEAYSPEQITAKKWKINISAGGSFVYGGGSSDQTSAGGGQFSAQQPFDLGVQSVAGGISTPSISDLGSLGNFGGIASAALGGVQNVGGLISGGIGSAVTSAGSLVGSTVSDIAGSVTSTLGNGNLSGTLGIVSSGAISESVSQIPIVSESPFLSGFSVDSLTQSATSQFLLNPSNVTTEVSDLGVITTTTKFDSPLAANIDAAASAADLLYGRSTSLTNKSPTEI